MMLPVGLKLTLRLARCKFKASWVKFVGIRPTRIYYQLKKIFEYVKDLSASRNFLAPMRFVTSLIFSFVCFPQLGDDLLPHSQEGSEKPMTKDFQFSYLT